MYGIRRPPIDAPGPLFVINLSLRKERFITIFFDTPLGRISQRFWRVQVFGLCDLVIPLVANGRQRVVCLLQIVTSLKNF